MKRILFIISLIAFFFVAVNAASDFCYLIGDVDVTSVNYWVQNTTDEIFAVCDNSTFQYEIGSDCGAGNCVYGVNDDGTLDCRTCSGGTGGNTSEEMQDAAWDVLTGTQTHITVVYDDANNEVDFVVSVTGLDDNNITSLSFSKVIGKGITLDFTSTNITSKGIIIPFANVTSKGITGLTATNLTSDLGLKWENITDYPSACAAGKAITQLGDSITCTAFQTGSEQVNTSAEMITAINKTYYYQFQVKNATDLECTDCIGSVEIVGLDFTSDDIINKGITLDFATTNITSKGIVIPFANVTGKGITLSFTSTNITDKGITLDFTTNVTSKGITGIAAVNLTSNLGLHWDNLTGYDLDTAWTGTLLAYDNITHCSDTQILKMSGGHWSCAVDTTGGGGNTTAEIQAAINSSSDFYIIHAADIACTDCLTGTEIDESSLTGIPTYNVTYDAYVTLNTSNSTIYWDGLTTPPASWASTYNATYDAFVTANVSSISNSTIYWDGLTTPPASWASSYNATYDAFVTANVSSISNSTIYWDGLTSPPASWASSYNATYDVYVTLNISNSTIYWDGLTTAPAAWSSTYNATYDANIDTFNTSQEMIDAVNITGYYQFQVKNATDLECTDCIGGTEVEGLDFTSTDIINKGITGLDTNNITSLPFSKVIGKGITLSFTSTNITDKGITLDFTTSNITSKGITGITAGNLTSNLGLNWGNLTGYNLDTVWTGSIKFTSANITDKGIIIPFSNVTSKGISGIATINLTSDLGLKWANLTGYPSACSASQYISAFGDTLTCSAIAIGEEQITIDANWDIGSYKFTAQTLESDVATGTAPLTIASTTKVANLNVDKLDSLDSTYFLPLNSTWDVSNAIVMGNLNVTGFLNVTGGLNVTGTVNVTDSNIYIGTPNKALCFKGDCTVNITYNGTNMILYG